MAKRKSKTVSYDERLYERLKNPKEIDIVYILCNPMSINILKMYGMVTDAR